MTTFKFRGSQYSYNPTRLKTPMGENGVVKYRGQEYSRHQAIATNPATKGLKYRGATY